MAALAQWCYTHRRIVVLAWLLVLAGLAGASAGFGTAYSDNFSLPGTQSTRALSLLSAAFPKQAGDSDTIVWHLSRGSVNDAAVRSRVQAMLAEGGAPPGGPGPRRGPRPRAAGRERGPAGSSRGLPRLRQGCDWGKGLPQRPA